MITSNHFSDENGIPAGGTTYGEGFAIGWQNGPLGRGEDRLEQNGAFVEDVIKAAIDRLLYYQGSKFASQYNKNALEHLTNALAELQLRTGERVKKGIEGTHEVG